MPAQVFNYQDLEQKVEAALRNENAFPRDTVDLTEGYLGRVRVLVVSPKLNGMSEQEKQNTVWEILKAELGEEAQGVSLVLAWGTDELR
jgi:stress-induced morphogen